MHAFMALFFYELIRDQIVFIWHMWAVVVVHGSSLLSAGPCLQYFWWPWRGKKMNKNKTNTPFLSKWCQRHFKHLFIHLCLCIYLFAPFDSRSELYGRRRSLWSTSCYHFSKKSEKNKNTDPTSSETDFTRQLFRYCSNTKALWIFVLILLHVSKERFFLLISLHFLLGFLR